MNWAAPDVVTMRQIGQQVLAATDRRRAVIGIPHWMAGVMRLASGCGTGGHGWPAVTNRITDHRIRPAPCASTNRVGREGVKTFADLGD